VRDQSGQAGTRNDSDSAMSFGVAPESVIHL